MTKLAPEANTTLATTQLVSTSHDMLHLLAALLSGAHGHKYQHPLCSLVWFDSA
jgi:hypothetical protein